jgi:hypothetical protein
MVPHVVPTHVYVNLTGGHVWRQLGGKEGKVKPHELIPNGML